MATRHRCPICGTTDGEQFAVWNKTMCDSCIRGRRYKLSSVDYRRLLAYQHGRCAICGAKPDMPLYPLHVDHDHARSNEHVVSVRGLLCANCNKGIGSFGDDPGRLRKAAAYLEDAAQHPWGNEWIMHVQFDEAWAAESRRYQQLSFDAFGEAHRSSGDTSEEE